MERESVYLHRDGGVHSAPRAVGVDECVVGILEYLRQARCALSLSCSVPTLRLLGRYHHAGGICVCRRLGRLDELSAVSSSGWITQLILFHSIFGKQASYLNGHQ